MGKHRILKLLLVNFNVLALFVTEVFGGDFLLGVVGTDIVDVTTGP